MDSQAPLDRQAALRRMDGPAIGILATGGLGVLVSLLSLGANLLSVGVAPFADRGDRMGWLFTGVWGAAWSVLGIALSGFVIWGGLQMRRMDSYALTLITCIVAMVPCTSPCCIVGLPIGIWALVVMHDPEVRPAFTR